MCVILFYFTLLHFNSIQLLSFHHITCSYLPGQEAGNVDVVLDGGFGDFCSDPNGIADEVACWLQDEPLLEIMSKAATVVGAPNAASDIVLDIGKFTEECMEKNQMT